MMERDELLLRAILDRSNGDILNIVQAAAELPGNMYDRFSKAYHEITGNDVDPNSMIGLVDRCPKAAIRCGHDNYARGHCSTMICPNYVNKCPCGR